MPGWVMVAVMTAPLVLARDCRVHTMLLSILQIWTTGAQGARTLENVDPAG